MIRLFPFYGSKIKHGKKYPSPDYDTIIEPFCGSAGYSCNYPSKNIKLYDRDPIVCGVINFLIKSSSKDILNLPLLKPGDLVQDLPICQEAKWLIGFWSNNGVTRPGNQLSAWAREQYPNIPVNFWGEKCRERLSKVPKKIRHWQIRNKSWEEIPIIEATWFIDPPYQVTGKHYICSNIDYYKLGSWSKTLPGQLIVCENKGADWLPFVDLYKNIGYSRNKKTEVIYIRRDEK